MKNTAARTTRSLGHGEPDLISDEDLDLHSILIDTNPGKPGGRIIFDSADYET